MEMTKIALAAKFNMGDLERIQQHFAEMPITHFRKLGTQGWITLKAGLRIIKLGFMAAFYIKD